MRVFYPQSFGWEYFIPGKYSFISAKVTFPRWPEWEYFFIFDNLLYKRWKFKDVPAHGGSGNYLVFKGPFQPQTKE